MHGAPRGVNRFLLAPWLMPGNLLHAVPVHREHGFRVVSRSLFLRYFCAARVSRGNPGGLGLKKDLMVAAWSIKSFDFCEKRDACIFALPRTNSFILAEIAISTAYERVGGE